ncbi:MAG: hypothetical protein LBJ92_04720 [Holosporales bacterium]|jgi:hypothetical protein|nr:hypothetical protein [Holosporales bacterium]
MANKERLKLVHLNIYSNILALATLYVHTAFCSSTIPPPTENSVMSEIGASKGDIEGKTPEDLLKMIKCDPDVVSSLEFNGLRIHEAERLSESIIHHICISYKERFEAWNFWIKSLLLREFWDHRTCRIVPCLNHCNLPAIGVLISGADGNSAFISGPGFAASYDEGLVIASLFSAIINKRIDPLEIECPDPSPNEFSDEHENDAIPDCSKLDTLTKLLRDVAIVSGIYAASAWGVSVISKNYNTKSQAKYFAYWLTGIFTASSVELLARRSK